jgi:hypothetical protein
VECFKLRSGFSLDGRRNFSIQFLTREDLCPFAEQNVHRPMAICAAGRYPTPEQASDGIEDAAHGCVSDAPAKVGIRPVADIGLVTRATP